MLQWHLQYEGEGHDVQLKCCDLYSVVFIHGAVAQFAVPAELTLRLPYNFGENHEPLSTLADWADISS